MGGARLTSALDVTDRLGLVYAYDKFKVDQRPTMLTRFERGGQRPRSATLDNAKRSDVQIVGHSVNVDYDLGLNPFLGNVNFQSISAVRRLETRSTSDFDGTGADMFRFILDNDFEQRSQELRLVGVTDSVKYAAGLSYYEESWSTYNPRWIFQFGKDNYNYDSRGADAKSYAGYAHASWSPQVYDQKFEFTAELRWTRDVKEMTRLMQSWSSYINAGPASQSACVCLRDADGMPLTASGMPASSAIPGGAIGPTDLLPLEHADSWSEVTSMLGVTYRWSDAINSYAKYSSGYKSGGINGVADTNDSFILGFDQETIDVWELGLKMRLFDDRLQFNAAAFYNDYNDIQVNTFVPSVLGIAVNNAGAASISGVELELLSAPIPNLELLLNYSYLKARYAEYLDREPASGDLVDFSTQRKFPYSPAHNINAALVYTFKGLPIGDARMRLDYRWLDDHFVGVINDPTTNIASYGLLNARLTLSDIGADHAEGLSLSVWAENLTDVEYTVAASNLRVFTVNQWGDPRSYGMELTWQF